MGARGTDETDRAFARFVDRRDAGDLAQVFDATAPRLMLVAVHLAGDAAAAEDLVQSTFLDAIRSADRFTPGSPVMPWLWTILTRHARKLARRRRRVHPLADDAEPDRLAGPGDDPADRAAEREVVARVASAVEALPKPYREVLTLRLVHGLRPVDIAGALDRPLGTVHAQLSRGLARLRDVLPESLSSAVLLAVLGTGSGLAAVRAQVMSAAAARPAIPLAFAALFGGVLMNKTLIAAAAALVLAVASATILLDVAHGSLQGRTGSGPPRAAPVDTALERPGADGDVAAAPEHHEPGRIEVPAAGDEATTTRLVIRVTRAASGELLPHHALRLVHVDGWPPGMRLVRTGADGVASIDGIEPGRVGVLNRGAIIDVAPGRTTRHELRLAPFYEVRGVVVDPDGRPITGAVLWETAFGISNRTAVLATRAGPAGEFAWTSWSMFEDLYATAPGYSASPVFQLRGAPDDPPPSLRIALRPASGVVAGVVVDEHDCPLAGADVALRARAPDPVDLDAEKPFFKMDGRFGPLLFARTDELGRFRFDDLPVGKASLHALVEGAGQVRGEVEVVPGGVAELRLVLGPPVVVAGRVTDEDGRGVEGAMVTVGLPFDFGSVSAGTDAGGHYRLVGALSGELSLSAWRADHERVYERRTAADGDSVRFDPVLPRRGNRVVCGFLLDENGAPLAGWRVRSGGACVGTGADGGFEVPGHASDPPELSASPMVDDVPRRMEPPRPLCRDSEPRDGAFVYRLLPESEPSAFLAGRLLLPRGSTAFPVHLNVRSELPVFRREYRIDPATGAFRIGPLSRGTYAVCALGDALPEYDLGAHALQSGRTLDLGEHAPPPQVPLAVTVRRSDGVDVGTPCARLRDASGRDLRGHFEDGRLIAPPLPPGRYELDLHGPELRWRSVPFDLRTGESQELSIELSAGTPVRFVGRVSQGASEPDEVRLVVTDGGGQLVARIDTYWQLLQQDGVSCGFAPGVYQVTAESAGRPCGTADFAVDESVGGPVDVRVELR